MSFIIWCLELHPPAIENIVAFIFPAEIPQRFAWEDGSEIEFLQFFINDGIKALFTMTGTVPKFYSVVTTLFKEVSEFMWNSCWINLIGCTEESKILLAVWMESVMTTILLMLGIYVAWFILHLIAKSSTSVVVMFTAWWTVLMTEQSCIWIWVIKVVTWFFMLASSTTMTAFESDDAWRVAFSRLCKWFLMLLSLFLSEE